MIRGNLTPLQGLLRTDADVPPLCKQQTGNATASVEPSEFIPKELQTVREFGMESQSRKASPRQGARPARSDPAAAPESRGRLRAAPPGRALRLHRPRAGAELRVLKHSRTPDMDRETLGLLPFLCHTLHPRTSRHAHPMG